MGVKGKADENCVSSPAIGGVIESRVESGERVPIEGEDRLEGPSEFCKTSAQYVSGTHHAAHSPIGDTENVMSYQQHDRMCSMSDVPLCPQSVQRTARYHAQIPTMSRMSQ